MHLSQDLQELFTVTGLINMLVLTVLEIVLGVDNIIFISIIAGKLPRVLQKKARTIGLAIALLIRVIMLFSITWIIGFTQPIFSIGDYHCTGRDLILLAGGVFLIYKTIVEIKEKIEGHATSSGTTNVAGLTLKSAIIQIVIIDFVFSFDSILTAVGVVRNVLVMIAAVIISMVIMLIFSERVSDFINKNPTVKMLALSFLVMIGVVLVSEAFHYEIEKAYIYVALVFSLTVEQLNMRMRKVHARKQKNHNA